ncbi:MAG: DUF4367 domain-containing protein [Candidatus Saccharibacteria bacterium]|nr:DUF4367 domain-containing protein [Candidatus Saccharibacteria bacterium]
MDGVIKNSRRGGVANHASSVDHRRVQRSSTLNRKFVKKPVARPKVTSSVAAGAKSLRRAVGGRTILQKGGSVKLQPIHNVAAKQQPAQAQKAERHISVGEIKRVTVHHSIDQQNAQKQQAQSAQAQRKAAIQQVAKKRDEGVYVKNARVQAVKERMAAKKAAAKDDGAKRLTAKQMKDRAIQQALSRMNRIDNARSAGAKSAMQIQLNSDSQSKKGLFRGKKFAIAASMAVVTVALLGYLVYLNMPDISARVAAMHAGIEKPYPSYIPSGYRLDGLVKEDNGRITMNFKNEQNRKFTLQEEKSSWDSVAVLANYVKKNWGTDYSIAKGQGLTIYISGSNAVWVNGGVLYVINDPDGGLNSNDLHDIAVSL